MVTPEVFRTEKLQHSISAFGDVSTFSDEAGSKFHVTSLCVCVQLFRILVLKTLLQAENHP